MDGWVDGSQHTTDTHTGLRASAIRRVHPSGFSAVSFGPPSSSRTQRPGFLRIIQPRYLPDKPASHLKTKQGKKGKRKRKKFLMRSSPPLLTKLLSKWASGNVPRSCSSVFCNSPSFPLSLSLPLKMTGRNLRQIFPFLLISYGSVSVSFPRGCVCVFLSVLFPPPSPVLFSLGCHGAGIWEGRKGRG